MDFGVKVPRKAHPRDKASLVSKWTFFYTYRLFKKTIKKDLDENDLYNVISGFESEKLGDELEKHLKQDLEKHESISVYRVLWSCYGREYLLIGLLQLAMRSFLITSIPFTVEKLVSYFVPGQIQITTQEAYIYTALVVGLNLLNCIYIHNYMLLITAFGLKIRTAFCSVMYRKALKLTPSTLSEVSTGKIITLITKDVTALEKTVLYGNDVWIGFMQAMLVCGIVYAKIGLAAFAGIGTFLLILPIQIVIGKQASRFRKEAGKTTDTRLQLTKETFSNIKLIKMFTWESLFCKKIENARIKELSAIVKVFITKILILLIGGLTANIAFYFLIMTHIWLGNTILSAHLVYYIISSFQKLRHAMSVVIPMGITEAAELYASVKRMEHLLQGKEVQKLGIHSSLINVPAINLKNLSISVKEKVICQNVSFTIPPGLTIITGPAGSGKTTFLKVLLQEIPTTEGVVDINGSLSYAPQEPWIFPSTIKQNIVFGESFDPQRYSEVLRVCALQYDIDQLENGDDTVIGDNGTNLSKGQQARINLARAVYRNSDIYLLDDCLASLDAHVRQYVFIECFNGMLKNKLCIFVTHNMKFIKDSNCLILVEDGHIRSEMILNGENKFLLHDIEEGIAVTSPLKDAVDVEIEDESETASLIKDDVKKNNIYHEKKKTGKVDFKTYFKYVQYGGGIFLFGFIVILLISTQVSKSYTDKLISNWVTLEQNIFNYEADTNRTNSTRFQDLLNRHSTMSIYFTSMVSSTALLSLFTAILFFSFTKRASHKLHKLMISSTIKGVLTFFDKNLLGNILNRFSKDLTTIDEELPFILYELAGVFLTLSGIIGLIASTNLLFLLPAFILIVLLYFIRLCYLPTGRSLQRLEASTRSPIIGHLTASLEGVTTIRAFDARVALAKEFDKHQDLYTSSNYDSKCCSRGFGFVLDMLCNVFVTAIVFKFLMGKDDNSVGDVGLAITQSFMLTGLLQFGVRQWAEVENKMTSVERALEYTNVSKEDPTGKVIKNWPTNGKIVFDKVSLTYNKSEQALKKLSFQIQPGEKISVVGRTGAGKSSLISALFRLHETDGSIFIDDSDIKTLNLRCLRQGIGIIPQDPALFSGTIRSNIDPKKQLNDKDIWAAMEKVHLNQLILNLDEEICENGLNFSAGQRQLICLARAIANKYKILILDEATSNIDEESDNLIYDIIQENFANSTVITIAHRLENVVKYADKIMVMDAGELVEFDSPQQLLQNKGAFYEMAKKSDIV